jgi:hypothetical protein
MTIQQLNKTIQAMDVALFIIKTVTAKTNNRSSRANRDRMVAARRTTLIPQVTSR